MTSCGSPEKTLKTDDLPPELLDKAIGLLADDATCKNIGDFLSGEGFDIGRHGREFFEVDRGLKIIEAKSRVLVSGEPGGLSDEAAEEIRRKIPGIVE